MSTHKFIHDVPEPKYGKVFCDKVETLEEVNKHSLAIHQFYEVEKGITGFRPRKIGKDDWKIVREVDLSQNPNKISYAIYDICSEESFESYAKALIALEEGSWTRILHLTEDCFEEPNIKLELLYHAGDREFRVNHPLHFGGGLVEDNTLCCLRANTKKEAEELLLEIIS